MATLDLMRLAIATVRRAPWCTKSSQDDVMSVLIEDGDLAKAAETLDKHAEFRKMAVAEVCRVKRGNHEAAYARLESA